MSVVTTKSAGYVAVEVLARAGVRRFYTVPGESFLEILDAAEQHPGVSLVSTRHESGAAFMAEADAKFTGVPAVAMATRGVGASNLAIGVHTARQDSTPMVVLLGHVETPFLGREAFQEVDLAAFYAPIAKWTATVHRADRLAEFVERGLRIATTGRPGPVMLALPADLLGENVPVPPETGMTTVPRPAPGPEEVGFVARRLAEARRPVIIAGEGARDAREELLAFAEAFDVGVYAAFRRQDVFPNEHPLYLGHLTLATPPETLRALDEADLVLVVGSRLDEVTTQSYGVPAAVAAKLAAPERRVVAVAGDGGFLMTGQELETAVRYGAAILVVVFRNGMHGTIAMHQARELGRTAGTEIGDVDLASYARSLGAEGYTVRDPGELVPALEGALASEAVALVDVVTDPDIISPSARLSELAGVVGNEAEG